MPRTHFINLIAAIAILFSFNTAYAQEDQPEGEMPAGQQMPPMPDMPKSEMVRMHLEGITMSNTDQFLNSYHEEIQLLNFPDQLIVEGIEDATKYWEVQFKSEDEKPPFEVAEVEEIGNTVFAPYFQINMENGQRERKAILVNFKDNKFYRIYFIK